MNQHSTAAGPPPPAGGLTELSQNTEQVAETGQKRDRQANRDGPSAIGLKSTIPRIPGRQT
eukprot:5627773-Prymnesium_polylepis.1